MWSKSFLKVALVIGTFASGSHAVTLDLLGPLGAECEGKSVCELTLDGVTATLQVSGGVFHQQILDGITTFGADGPGTLDPGRFDYSTADTDPLYGNAQVVTITFDQKVKWVTFSVSGQTPGEVSFVSFSGESFYPFEGSGSFAYFNGCTVADARKGGYVALAAIEGEFSFDGFEVVPAEGGKKDKGSCSNSLADVLREFADESGQPLFGHGACDPTNDGITDMLDFFTVIFCAGRRDCARCVNSCDVNHDGIEADFNDIRVMVGVLFRGLPCPGE